MFSTPAILLRERLEHVIVEANFSLVNDDVYPQNSNSMTTNTIKKENTVSCQYCRCNDLVPKVEETKLDILNIHVP